MRHLTLAAVLCLAFTGAACERMASSQAAISEPPAGSYSALTADVMFADGSTAALQGATVTPQFFEGLKGSPLLGRPIVAADHRADSNGVVMISHRLWSTRLNSRPEIIGQTLNVGGREYVVVGVMPSGFGVPTGAMFWTPARSP